MKQYRIIANCDPYNAQFHYHRYEEVLRYEGATPVEWVWGNEIFDTKEEARKEFENWADENGAFYDEQQIAEECGTIEDLDGLENYTPEDWKRDNTWYEGPGWYSGQELIYRQGKDYYREDTMIYRIEEF